MARLSPLLGTWRLLSCEHRLKDGRKNYPFSRKPSGRLIYSSDGTMMVILMDPRRGPCASGQLFEATDAEQAAAARGFLAYSGRWRVRGSEVIHSVDLSLFPNWLGRSQVRRFELKGGRVRFSTRSFLIRGVSQTAHLVWERG